MRYSASKNSVTLKTELAVVQGHWTWRCSIDHNTTFYWSAIVNIALAGTVFELFDIEWYHDLEIWVTGHSRSFKPVPLKSLGAVSYSPSIVTMALSCIIWEIKQDIGWKSWFFPYPLVFDAPVGGGRFPSEYYHPLRCGKSRMVGLPDDGKIEDMCNRLDSIPACDRRTDRRTSFGGIVRAMHTRRAVKKIEDIYAVNSNNSISQSRTITCLD